ncbi:hypothetical protein [Thioalkalivibrio sp. ALJ15]|uniref:hypothetical protein n=1 Tax=Thioalkalivibrio sp. ALJ15 TaxID=748652 RepID=UPI0012EA5649|nr:hypothetical protein [Thioalkalivibrio sp. ALJ15]
MIMQSIHQFAYDFILAKTPIDLMELSETINLGGYYLKLSSYAPVKRILIGRAELIIIGDFVLSDGRSIYEFEEGAQHAIEKDFIERAGAIIDGMLGHFVAVLNDRGRVYVFPDATSSVPVYYPVHTADVLASSIETQIDPIGSDGNESTIIRRILNSSSPGQVLPYDLCPTPGVRVLLPNHYLKLFGGYAVRRDINIEEDRNKSLESVAKDAAAIIRKAADYFSSMYSVRCPLTGGLDSRVVLSAFLSSGYTDEVFTFKHERLGDHSKDVVIPVEVSEKFGLSHSMISMRAGCRVDVYENKWDREINYPKNSHAIKNLCKIVETYGRGVAVPNGNVIGQIGKSSVGGCIENNLFGPRILRAKNHYCSRAGLGFEKRYLESLENSAGSISDFYSWEVRCGKWGALSGNFYRRAGVLSLNLFNCTNLIKSFCAIPRELRVKGLLHREIVRELDSDFLHSFPIKAKSSYLRSSSVLFAAASLLKFYGNLLRRKLHH